MELIKDKSFDAERAFYGTSGANLANCKFDGPADGESAFKEAKKISVTECYFNLRYPFWHNDTVCIDNCMLTENCRAALWYSENIEIKSTKLHGIKALRECSHASVRDCDIISQEFGWFCNDIRAFDSSVLGEYFMLRSNGLNFKNVNFKGKYSFQYIENSVFENCDFDTKDAFWHAKNVVVKNSRIKGEYLAWYAENITFENCTLIGTQPLCYCKGLKLIDCRMEGCDLSFEKSEVEASVSGHIDSVKNPYSGSIVADSIGEIIDEYTTKCKIEVTKCPV